MLLCVSYYDCTYHLVDIENNQQKSLTQGYSDRAHCIRLAPGFDHEDFPYVLCKESQWICILNLHKGAIYQLVKNEDKCANGRRLEFMPREKKKQHLEPEDAGKKVAGKGKEVRFLTTGCTILKEKGKSSYVDNGCVRMYKMNEDLFVELSKSDQ